jgi:hypothetical protein
VGWETISPFKAKNEWLGRKVGLVADIYAASSSADRVNNARREFLPLER